MQIDGCGVTLLHEHIDTDGRAAIPIHDSICLHYLYGMVTMILVLYFTVFIPVVVVVVIIAGVVHAERGSI